MNLGFLITARMGSRRLEHKHFCTIGDRPALHTLLDRVRHAQAALAQHADIWIATGNATDNHAFEVFTQAYGAGIFYGSDDNVPMRHLQLALTHGLEALVSIDGDDIFCAPEAMLAVAQSLLQGHGLVHTTGLPLGMNAWGYHTEVLERCVGSCKSAVLETGWGRIFDGESREEIRFDPPAGRDIRATLDYAQDLEFFRACTSQIPNCMSLSFSDLINEIERLRLHQINADLTENYWANFQSALAMEKGIS